MGCAPRQNAGRDYVVLCGGVSCTPLVALAGDAVPVRPHRSATAPPQIEGFGGLDIYPGI